MQHTRATWRELAHVATLLPRSDHVLRMRIDERDADVMAQVLLGALADERSDVYSLSVMLWEALTHQRPFSSGAKAVGNSTEDANEEAHEAQPGSDDATLVPADAVDSPLPLGSARSEEQQASGAKRAVIALHKSAGRIRENCFQAPGPMSALPSGCPDCLRDLISDGCVCSMLRRDWGSLTCFLCLKGGRVIPTAGPARLLLWKPLSMC